MRYPVYSHYELIAGGLSYSGSTDRPEPQSDGGLQLILQEEPGPAAGTKQLHLEVTNAGGRAIELGSLRLGLRVSDSIDAISWYESDWGTEFTPLSRPPGDGLVFGSRSGRSNKGFAPYAQFHTPGFRGAMTLAWSGNFTFSARPDSRGWLLLFELETESFQTGLAPGASFRMPAVLVSCGADAEETAAGLRALSGTRVTPAPLLGQPVFALNSWWPFEDIHIDEETLLANSAAGADLGLTDSVLDSGWFGPSTAGSDWQSKRGDWTAVNRLRFPGGLRGLSSRIRGLGLRAGVWCEIETVDAGSEAARDLEPWLARRDGKFLNYLCLANQEAYGWARERLLDLIEAGFTWLKLDFNVDPETGCNERGHAHGAEDGLYGHIAAFYRLLDEIHAKHPGVILENCSSGGFRLDAGILGHADVHFLSDPDYTEHHLQVLWGALGYLPVQRLYHFTWSDTLGEHNRINRPFEGDVSPDFVSYVVRACMIGIPAFSYDLRRLSAAVKERLAEEVRFYRAVYTDFVRDGEVRRLTGQPLRDGGGERFPGFQLLNQAGDSLVLAFRLTGGPEMQRYALHGLKEELLYSVLDIDTGVLRKLSGRELTETGLMVTGLDCQTSAVYMIQSFTP